MADEVIKVIRIETGGSEQTVKGLKDEINSLRDALLNTEKGSEEYKSILEQLIEDQKKLTDVMRAGQNEAKAAEGSYNSLVNKMAALKKVWRETTDEASRKELGNQIKDINNKLSKMDQSIGDFRRNVGNYTNSITSAFGAMGGAAKGMIGPLNGVKNAFQALSSHPLVAVLTALAALLINGVVKGFKSSEEATNKLTTAFSGFKAIGDVITKLFQGIANVIGNVANAIVNLLDKWGLLSKGFKERQKIAQDEINLAKRQRENIVKNADLEKEAADLRAKAADKDKYTAQERLNFLEQAGKKEEEIAENEYLALKQEYEIIVAKNSLSQSSAEAKEAEAKAYAAMVAAQTQYLEKTRSNNKAISRVRQEMIRDARNAENALLNLQKELLQQEYDLAEDGSAEQLRLAKELRKKELEIQQAGFKEKIKNRKDYEKAMKMSVEAYNADIARLEYESINKIVDRERELTRRRSLAYREGSKEQYESLKADEIKIHNLYKTIIEANGDLSAESVQAALATFENAEELTAQLSDKTLDNIKALEADSLVAIQKFSDSLTDAEVAEMETFNELVLSGTRPMSLYYQTQLKQLLDFYEGEHAIIQKFGESDEEFALRRAAIWKQIVDANHNIHKAVIEEENTYIDFANANKKYYDTLDEKNQKHKTGFFKLFFGDFDQKEMDEAQAQLNRAMDLYDRAYNEIGEYIISKTDVVSREFGNGILNRLINDTDADELEESLEEFKGIWGNIFPDIETIKKLRDGKLEPEKLKELFNDTLKTFSKGLEDAIADKILTGEEGIDSILNELFKFGGLPEGMMDDYINSLQEWVDAEGNILKKRKTNWENLAGGISSLLNNTASAYDALLKYQVDHNEKSEKAAEDEFDIIKGLRISAAVVDTIQGALAAFMGWQDKGQPWGAIIGGIQAAAVAAAGAAQIAQIANTKFGSAGNASSVSSAAMAQVTPVMVDYTPQVTTNMTGQQEAEDLANAITSKPIRAYVVESDISDAQARANTRNNESTW